MYHVYVLISLKNDKRYIGSTRIDPKERLKQHNYGGNAWTKQNKPFRLAYTEQYSSYREARKRESFLNSGVGRQEINKILGG